MSSGVLRSMTRALAVGVVLATALAGAATPDSLRVYSIQPACFDYLFTSVSTGVDGKPILAFNHRNGRTFLVRIGGRLGDYRVAAYEPRIRRVFVPSTKSEREEKVGRAMLETSDGRLLELELAQPLVQPGWMAHLVSVATGEWRLVREQDEWMPAGDRVLVKRISETTVSVLRGDQEDVIPFATSEEKATLVGLWEQYRKQVAMDRKVALQKEEDEAREEARNPLAARTAPPRPFVTRRIVEPIARTRAVFGTEFRYPTEFEIRPAVMDASGKIIQPALVIPRNFQTRTSGISIETY
ncbi:MAG: hypothetical protein WCS01_08505 [bacterium]